MTHQKVYCRTLQPIKIFKELQRMTLIGYFHDYLLYSYRHFAVVYVFRIEFDEAQAIFGVDTILCQYLWNSNGGITVIDLKNIYIYIEREHSNLNYIL